MSVVIDTLAREVRIEAREMNCARSVYLHIAGPLVPDCRLDRGDSRQR
jgi:hypothetical protein